MKLNLLKLDQKSALLKRRLRRSSQHRRESLSEWLKRSFVYHDHALEGLVLTELELSRGINHEAGKDICEEQMYDAVHRLWEAVVGVADEGVSFDFSLEQVKAMHVLVAPESDPAAGRYRKVDGPIGAYMQGIAPARSISYQLRRLLGLQDEYLGRHPIQAAAEFHYQLMQVFPFDKLTGRAARLLLSAWLVSEGFPLLVIPASVRAEYFAALSADSAEPLTALVIDLMEVTIDGAIDELRRQPKIKANAA